MTRELQSSSLRACLMEKLVVMETATKHHLTMKLLIDKKKDVVLFAEAGKDVVDFIFHLLALPIGTVIRLLNTKTGMVGSLGNLYKSFETLDNTYLQSSSYNKDILLKPKIPTYGGGSSETLLLPAAATPNNNATTAVSNQTVYRCPRSIIYPTCFAYDYMIPNNNPRHIKTCRDYITHNASTKCPFCKSLMNQALTLSLVMPEAAASQSSGYVKEAVTFMVMDNLEVKPISNISSIALLSNCHVTDLGALEEKVVEFGYDEGVKLLKASMESTNALTNVFLRGSSKKRAASI